MFTLYQEWSIRSCSHFVDTTKQRHRTGTSRSQTSNIVPERLIERVWVLPVPIHTPEHLLPSHWISVLFSCLFTSAMVKIPVCTTPKCGTEPNPTCYAKFWSSARHSCPLLQKSRWNHPFYVWTEAISGMVFVPVQKLSDIVWTLPKNMLLLQTWLTKKSKSSAEGMPRQNIPTDTRGRANFLGTVEARRIIKETVSVYRNLQKKKFSPGLFCDWPQGPVA